MYDHELIAGRYFDEGEVQGGRRVAVLGNKVSERLGEISPTLLIGKTIQMRGQPYEVIGVLAEKGEAAFLRPDEQIFIPITTAQYRLFGGRERLSSIYTATASADLLDQAYGEIDRIMRRAPSHPAGGRRQTSESVTRPTCSAPSTRRTAHSRCCWRGSQG